MTHTLIVFEAIPQQTRLFAVPSKSMSAEQHALLVSAAGQTSGAETCEHVAHHSIHQLCELFESEWAAFEVDNKAVSYISIDRVLVTGMIV